MKTLPSLLSTAASSTSSVSTSVVTSTSTIDSRPTPTSSSEDGDGSGLSTRAKAGIGVGVGIGGLLAILAILFLIHKRQRPRKQNTASMTDKTSAVEARSKHAEYDGQPIYEKHKKSVPAEAEDNAHRSELQVDWLGHELPDVERPWRQ